MQIFSVPLPPPQEPKRRSEEHHVTFLTYTIGGAMSNPANPEWTDVFTDTFPNGVTVDMNIKNFNKAWFIAMHYDEDDVQGEAENDDESSELQIVFTPDDDPVPEIH